MGSANVSYRGSCLSAIGFMGHIKVCGPSPKAAIDKEYVQLCANSTLQNQTVGGLHLPAKFLPKLTPYKNKIKQEAHMEPEICLLSGSTVARHL